MKKKNEQPEEEKSTEKGYYRQEDYYTRRPTREPYGDGDDRYRSDRESGGYSGARRDSGDSRDHGYRSRMYGREDGQYDREHGYYRGPSYYDEKPRKKKRKKWPIVLAVILIIILALCAVVFVELGRIDRTTLKNILRNEGIGDNGTRDLVFYGVDSRTGDIKSGTNSDTIMICSIDSSDKTIKLVSIYRDTYLDNTDGSYRKATECYSVGGAEQSVNMLNKNLDLDIEDFVTVDFNAVIKAIDLVGGIDLNITDEEMELINGYCVENKEVTGVDYTPLTSSGDVHLTGIQALAYCRIRYTSGWDFKRTERQRTVLSQCFQKAKAQGITKLVQMANEMIPYIYTSLSNTEILTLAGAAAGYSIGETTGFPFETAFTTLSDGADIVVPVTLASNVTELHSFLYGTTDYTPSQTVQDISSQIVNVTGISSVS